VIPKRSTGHPGEISDGVIRRGCAQFVLNFLNELCCCYTSLRYCLWFLLLTLDGQTLWPAYYLLTALYVTDSPVCCTSLYQQTKILQKMLLMGKSITKSSYSIFSLGLSMIIAEHAMKFLICEELLNVTRGILRNWVCVVYRPNTP
jgi:hypothetical protein